jgi:hypothetical protein
VNHPDDTCPHCGHHWRHHDLMGCHFPTTPDAECNCLRWSPYPRGFPDPGRTAWPCAVTLALVLAALGAGLLAAWKGC